TILGFSAVAIVKPFGTSSISNPGPHGFSQVLYAYVSSTGNNGSAFGGLNVNTMWYNTSTAVAQLLGRFFMIIPVLAIAGSHEEAAKQLGYGCTCVVPHGVHIQAAERRAVVAGRRDVGVEHLRKTVRAGVRDARSAKGFDDSNEIGRASCREREWVVEEDGSMK